MIAITDPINNFVFEVHQYPSITTSREKGVGKAEKEKESVIVESDLTFEMYLDVDGSGTHPACVNSTIGLDR